MFRIPFLIVILLSVGLPILAEVNQTNDITQAMLDAERDAKSANTLIWGFAGFGCGVFGVIGSYFVTPEVPIERLLGKSPEYIAYYTATYKERVRKSQVQVSIVGCVVNALTAFAYYSLIAQDQF